MIFDLNPFALFRCIGCDIPVRNGSVCRVCHQSVHQNSELLETPFGGADFFAPMLFSVGSTHQMFRYWKTRGGKFLSQILFQENGALIDHVRDYCLDGIIPIPHQAHRSWERGHSPAFEVAWWWSQQLDVPIVHALGLEVAPPQKKTKENVSKESLSKQALLDAAYRSLLPNPFQLKLVLEPASRWLLVDDLMTTGGTLSRAVDAIRDSHQGHLLSIGVSTLGYRPRQLQRRFGKDEKKDLTRLVSDQV